MVTNCTMVSNPLLVYTRYQINDYQLYFSRLVSANKLLSAQVSSGGPPHVRRLYFFFMYLIPVILYITSWQDIGGSMLILVAFGFFLWPANFIVTNAWCCLDISVLIFGVCCVQTILPWTLPHKQCLFVKIYICRIKFHCQMCFSSFQSQAIYFRRL